MPELISEYEPPTMIDLMNVSLFRPISNSLVGRHRVLSDKISYEGLRKVIEGNGLVEPNTVFNIDHATSVHSILGDYHHDSYPGKTAREVLGYLALMFKPDKDKQFSALYQRFLGARQTKCYFNLALRKVVPDIFGGEPTLSEPIRKATIEWKVRG